MQQPKARRSAPGVGLGLLAIGLTTQAHAQTIEPFLPQAVPGFDRSQGVTVLSRLRPLYDEPGVRLGDFLVNGRLDESVGYDTNINGTSKGASSGFVETSPSISATSDWSRNRLGIAVGMSNYSYFSVPNQGYTNDSVAIGTGYTIGRQQLSVAYSHLDLHETGADIGAVASSTPLSYSVDTLRSDYPIETGRFTFTPNIDLRRYSFGSASIQGQTISQQYRDRNVATGGVTTRYSLSDQRGLLFVVQGSTSQFLNTQAGIPRPNSETILVLAGLDYQANGPWRYRLLAGGEFRQYQSATYGSHAAPVLEADVIYTPTGLTTLTAILRREIEDPQSELTAGYDYTTLGLTVDHELKRNVLLQGRGSFQAAQFLTGGGTATNYTLGGGVSWLLNRRVRLSADYDFTSQTSSNNSTLSNTTSIANIGALSVSQQLTTFTSGSYNRNVLLFGLHLRL